MNELHHVVRRFFLLADAENRHDIGMVQLGGGPGLTLESPPLLGVSQRVLRQDLERHMPAQRDLFGLVDDSHSTAADLAKDSVIAELIEVRDGDRAVA